MDRKHLFIDGQWRATSDYYTLRAPYSGEAIAEVASASEEDVDQAIASAHRSSQRMAAMPAHQRAAILDKLARALEERESEAARIIAVEAAKPWTVALAEVRRTVQTYRFAAEEAKRIHGETIPLDAAPGGEGRVAYTVRKPLGVIAAIAPFNFPMNLVAHKLGPALAAGNAVVLKPASQTPLSAFNIAELLQDAGLPEGALNVVTGSGRTVGDRLVTDDRVQMITFTGSPAVGKEIRRKAGLKRVTLELGSNSAVIVDRITDLETIVPRCVFGAFANSGQVCISLQRIYVHEQLYDDFVSRFVSATERLVVGDPLDPKVDVSALISPSDTQRTLEWIAEAESAGARIACGGRAEAGIVLPTVILDADRELKVSCREVFAPVVLINRIASVDEGIELVNDSPYGLQAGIYTSDLATAFAAADKLEAGGVIVNDIPSFRVDHMPYGGVKESGIGREGVKYAVEEMTELKLIVFNRN